MGTWGSGNFDSDDALEVLEEVANVFHPEIDGFLQSSRVGIEDLPSILACVAIENALVRHCNLQPRDPKIATELRDKILAIYSEEAEGLIDDPEFLKQREAEIKRTLKTMMNASHANE